MAGRPKMMYKRVDALAKEMESVGNRFHALMPEMYKKPDAVADRICKAWRDAANMADESLEAINELLGELASKAGIEQTPRFPRPAPIFFELDDRMTFDGDTATLREWCGLFDRDPQLVRRRLAAGQDIELAVTAPPTEEEMLAGFGPLGAAVADEARGCSSNEPMPDVTMVISTDGFEGPAAGASCSDL